MLLLKMKKLVALGMIVFVLTAGFGVWRHAAVAGKTEKPKPIAAAAKDLRVVEQPPTRVGQIFIVGNKKIPDEVFLKRLGLYPGQLFNYADLRIAERNLARIKGLRSNPTVTVLDWEGEGEFKDIEIAVEEK